MNEINRKTGGEVQCILLYIKATETTVWAPLWDLMMAILHQYHACIQYKHWTENNCNWPKTNTKHPPQETSLQRCSLCCFSFFLVNQLLLHLVSPPACRRTQLVCLQYVKKKEEKTDKHGAACVGEYFHFHFNKLWEFAQAMPSYTWGTVMCHTICSLLSWNPWWKNPA